MVYHGVYKYGTLFLRMACVYISMIREYGPLCKHMIPSYGLVWSASLGWCIAPQTSPNSGLPWLPAQGDTAWAAIGTYVNTHKIINTWCFVRSIKRKEQEQTRPKLFWSISRYLRPPWKPRPNATTSWTCGWYRTNCRVHGWPIFLAFFYHIWKNSQDHIVMLTC